MCVDGKPQPSGKKGLQIVMNHTVSCDRHPPVHIGTGHMKSRSAFKYGTFSAIWRGHHVSGCDEPEQYAGFSCFSLYQSTPVWNEIAVCFTKFAPHQEVHFSIYNGKTQGEHAKKIPVWSAYITLDEPFHLGFHNYTIEKMPLGVAFWVDSVKRAYVDASLPINLPTEAMHLKVILRPFSSSIQGKSSFVSIQSISHEPVEGWRVQAEEKKLQQLKDDQVVNIQETNPYTQLKNWVYIEWSTGRVDWWTIKQVALEALGLKYPGGGLGSKYPIKFGRLINEKRRAILEFAGETQARTVAGTLDKRRNNGKVWSARVVTESAAALFGLDGNVHFAKNRDSESKYSQWNFGAAAGNAIFGTDARWHFIALVAVGALVSAIAYLRPLPGQSQTQQLLEAREGLE